MSDTVIPVLGYRILKELMSFAHKAVNSPFIDLPDMETESSPSSPIIASAMSLSMIQTSFEDLRYESITDFVRDFRKMLESYLRHYGPEHIIAKKAQKLDIMMEQKLALLSK